MAETINGMAGDFPPQPVAAPGARSAAGRGEVPRARFAHNFSSIVAVLMKEQQFKNLRLADLYWLVLPAMVSSQWELAQACMRPSGDKAGGDDDKRRMVVPAAVAFWASVSPEIDARLSSELDKPLLLRPDEWATGDILWLVAVAGDRRVVPKLLEQLEATRFKGRTVKRRTRGPDGQVTVETRRSETAPMCVQQRD
jgi:hemolysin-activating ACP:hemolysin acyltransferase